MDRLRSSVAVAFGLLSMAVAPPGGGNPPPVPASSPSRVVATTVPESDMFQFPLPAMAPHCLGFGSQWRYCNGAPLRECADGAVWLHTGMDVVATAGETVTAAADGVIAGYLIDPTFRGGVLIRHDPTFGTVLTQYWHVWLRPGFGPGTHVMRGEAFADVADMGGKTHLHFAVFNGVYEPHAWNGALPPSACSGFPAFPYRFIDPNAFVRAHELAEPPPPRPRVLAP